METLNTSDFRNMKFDYAKKESKRVRYDRLWFQLENQRATFVPTWKDLADYFTPRRIRLQIDDVNRGDRRNLKIIDSTGTLSARTLASGMMSGITSPARPWFRLTTSDPDLADFEPVKEWLFKVAEIMRISFLKSNVYNTLPLLYSDLGIFATAPISLEEDYRRTMHSWSFPIGSYYIAKDNSGTVNTFVRDYRMTVRQIVETFGRLDPTSGQITWDNISSVVKVRWDQGQYETWINIRNVIQPNPNWNPRRVGNEFKKFSSCYYERGSVAGINTQDVNYDSGDLNKFLRESGYDYFPILCPRWQVTGEDVYGTGSPGIDCLGDVKQLQLGERRAMQAIEKMVNPPMVGPTALRNTKASILPGDTTYVDVPVGQKGFSPAHEVNFRIQELENKQNQCRQRIQRAMYEDLFLMMAESDRREITAREIDERREEKLLALGPVLEQLNQDLLDPMIGIAYAIHRKQGLLPPPPAELKGQALRVEYVSMMAQAQKLIGTAGLERFSQFVQTWLPVDDTIRAKVDTHELVAQYGDALSLPPKIIRPEEDTQNILNQQAQAQQQEQKIAQMEKVAGAAKNLSNARTSGQPNALTDIMQQANAGRVTPPT